MHRVSFAMFIITGALHLYASWKDKAEQRARTKPLLLGFLLLFYITADSRLCVYLILALAASWLGDILLIPRGNGWFTAGGVSFMFAHLFLILVFSEGIIKELVRCLRRHIRPDCPRAVRHDSRQNEVSDVLLSLV